MSLEQKISYFELVKSHLQEAMVYFELSGIDGDAYIPELVSLLEFVNRELESSKADAFNNRSSGPR